jgi:hypothetical protein
VTLDRDANGSLSGAEVSKGLSKIGDLIRKAAAGRGDDDSRRRVKRIKRTLGR